MRIDKFLTHSGILSRREAAKAIKEGLVTCNGETVKKPDTHIDENASVIRYCGKVIGYERYTYIMLNKPSGYVSATDDPKEKTVLELLPDELRRRGLFPCGRLDKNTVGLLILTNDGDTAHKSLSPKHHAEKKYYFECQYDIENAEKAQKGVTLDDGYKTMPCKIELKDKKSGIITLTEGKYHQIKRMASAYGNKITYLERISFSGITLDKGLGRGEWRPLTKEEEEKLKKR